VGLTCGSNVAVAATGVEDAAGWFTMAVEEIVVVLILVSAGIEQAETTNTNVKKTNKLDLTFPIKNLPNISMKNAARPGGTIG
jgi:hypothetical protein